MSLLLLVATSLVDLPVAAPVEAEPAWSATPRLLIQEAPHDETKSQAESSTYLRLTGGIVTTSDSDGPDEDIEFDEGYLLSLGLGHRFGASHTGLGFALELDGIWTDSDVSDDGVLQDFQDVSVAGALINGVLDFRVADQFSIYGAAGIGAAWLDIGTNSDSINDFDDEDGPFLAWQLKAGVGWHFTSSTSLHLGYRFLNIDDAQIDDGLGDSSFDLETEQHVLEVGLIFGI